MVLVTKLMSFLNAFVRLVEEATQGYDVFILIRVNDKVLASASASIMATDLLRRRRLVVVEGLAGL